MNSFMWDFFTLKRGWDRSRKYHWIRRKPLLRNRYFKKLIGMEGDSCGNSVTRETTGSGHARGERPGMEINF